MIYTCYVIDDESHAIEALVDLINKTPGFELTGSSQNPLEAIEKFRNGMKADITFLDIDMPELSGLDVADLLKDQTAIIFSTAHAGYAVEGFDKNISDFLLKPISYNRFLKAVNKVTAQISNKPQAVTVSSDTFFINPGTKGKMVGLKFSEIFYIEGCKNFVNLFTKEERQTPYLTMTEVELVLPDSFIRVHKSYIVNIEKIRHFDGSKITLNNEVTVPLGLSYKENFLKLIEPKVLRSGR